MCKALQSVVSQALKLASQYVELDKHDRRAPGLVLLRPFNPFLWGVNILVPGEIPSVMGLPFILSKLQVLCWTEDDVVLTWDFCALFVVYKLSWMSEQLKSDLLFVRFAKLQTRLLQGHIFISPDKSIWRLIIKVPQKIFIIAVVIYTHVFTS